MKLTESLLKRSYALYFVAIYAFYLALLLLALRERNPAFAVNATTILLPAMELAFLCVLGLAAWHVQRSRRLALPALLVALALPLLVMLVYMVQGFSAYLSGHYISVLALENYTDGSQYAAKPLLFLITTLGLGSWICLAVAALQARRQAAFHRPGKSFVFAAAVACLLFVDMFDSSSFTERTLQLRPDMAPVTSLARKFRDLHKARNSTSDMAETLGRQGIRLPNDDRFPLLHDRAYSSPLPFGRARTAKDKPNIIVIFAEGLSARFLETYGGKHQGLMPNIDRFAARSMSVHNYFSHTAATYRGIQGQLVSGYPRNGGAESGGWEAEGEDNTALLTSINYRTMADILLDRGYKTAFLSSSSQGASFNAMLRSLGFGTVYAVETLPELLGGRPAALSSGTSDAADAEIFSGLKGFLEKQAASGDKRPFFVATYNVGTHAFLDSDSAGITYGTGDNPALNRMHNFDAQLGKFLDYFQNSSFSNNTILIITADHATYPEPAVVKALRGEDYKAYFVDRIPLIVHHQGLALPAAFDANYRTSVDFAPTLLHLLSFQKVKNAFMGFSIFEQAPAHHVPLAAMGEEFYYIGPHGISKAAGARDEDAKHVAYQNYVRMYYWLESQNRVFPARETISN
ncbi:sulfatase-like hydrolase/transferase [Aminobacter anthyllidis]|uniref:sulfatase-like hydrolase/transferase n=1 Tax=Aminobacter anthyllidis TaxID=1035067 RepID=UPI0024543EA6|nr:sulfatase-like hydrolase/transferase [Aminobacter anthyllidis]MDH4989216.1 sulfatase-like hydrolase/transferase [Aminobacter anthyllidis]